MINHEPGGRDGDAIEPSPSLSDYIPAATCQFDGHPEATMHAGLSPNAINLLRHNGTVYSGTPSCLITS
ncbi:hypothetical protein VUR80DRAFT_2660 [Thermomyces stellatus]